MNTESVIVTLVFLALTLITLIIMSIPLWAIFAAVKNKDAVWSQLLKIIGIEVLLSIVIMFAAFYYLINRLVDYLY